MSPRSFEETTDGQTPPSASTPLRSRVAPASPTILTAPLTALATPIAAKENNHRAPVIRYRTQQLGNVEVFYREAGPVDAPVILLLHGFPSASHMSRDLIPALGRSLSCDRARPSRFRADESSAA